MNFIVVHAATHCCLWSRTMQHCVTFLFFVMINVNMIIVMLVFSHLVRIPRTFKPGTPITMSPWLVTFQCLHYRVGQSRGIFTKQFFILNDYYPEASFYYKRRQQLWFIVKWLAAVAIYINWQKYIYGHPIFPTSVKPN